jgi:peptidyl-prolyl cis-trans isomerase A (cyclophilin A)
MKRPTTLFAILIATLTSALFLAGSANAQPPAPAKPADPPKAAEQPKKDEPKKDEPKKGEEKPKTPPAATPENKNVPEFEFVKLSTSKGDIFLKLNRAKAPLSVENFLKYADKKFYDGTIFHRVIPNFMIQGGGFDASVKQKPTDPPIKNEWQNGLHNKKYSVAMARTQVADSATAQFFINVADNTFLDQARDGAAYAVFGDVVAGQSVVDTIAAVKTGTKNGMGDVPNDTITINSVTKVTEDDAKKAGAK